MVVEAAGESETAVLARDTAAAASSMRALAHDLSRELTAPLAIFDTRAKRWRAVAGADETQFPRVSDQLLSKSRSIELKLGQAVLWKRPEERGRVWLLLPVPATGNDGCVAFAGFRTGAGARSTASSGDSRLGAETVDHVRWGPICPEAALLAWGQQVVSRLQAERGQRLTPMAPARSRNEESERVVIGRLIRRLRISDPPQHFQTVATTVLRWSLAMTAVAWVPRSEAEPVVWSGEVPGLEGEAYRALPAPAGRESLFVFNDGGSDGSRKIPPAVQRYASVAAGTLGYLLAVNPVADRPIVRADIERLQFVASLIATQVSNVKIYADLKELLFGIIRGLTTAIDAKDTYTSGHSERVARIAVRLGHELGMPAAKLSDLYLAGLLHDVGKIGIDDVVLKKCGPLTPEEHKKIQSHVEIGVTILRDLKMLHHILPTVRHHHESLDGTGYPDKLAGDEIPFEARILAVADAFDAMSNNRPYRNRLSLAQIDRILREGRAVQWDPQVIDALYACRSDLEAIGEKGVGESLIGVVDVALERG
jgi:putative nucleotidyltransferase with HDIG domain